MIDGDVMVVVSKEDFGQRWRLSSYRQDICTPYPDGPPPFSLKTLRQQKTQQWDLYAKSECKRGTIRCWIGGQ